MAFVPVVGQKKIPIRLRKYTDNTQNRNVLDKLKHFWHGFQTH